MTDTLKGETIIYFGPEPWYGLWRNRHQLMSRFAAHNDVWYVEPPTTLRQLRTGSKRDTGAGRKYRSRLFTHDSSGVRLFHSPWWLPVTGRNPLKGMSVRLYLAVFSLVAGIRKRRAIIWLSRPAMIDYLDVLPAKLTIYHVVDEYSSYGSPAAEQREALVRREIELIRRVDIVVVVTRTLFQSKSPHNPHTYHVPNAVDFGAYDGCKAPAPPDLVDISRPIIGYSGMIGARLDLDLVAAAAESRPDWSYVFVGFVREEQSQAQIRRLSSLHNVHFLGQKSVVEIPAYIRGFDVCMIPYTVNLRAQHAGPLKLYEYAAASKPIVATDFPAARDFEGHIEIVHGRDEFLEACQRSLATDATSASILDNRRFAANNTWSHRVEQLSCIIRTHPGVNS